MPYLTGDAGFSNNRTIVITFPDTFGLRLAVRGALLELTREENWEQLGTMSTEDAAAYMLAAFEDIYEFIP